MLRFPGEAKPWPRKRKRSRIDWDQVEEDYHALYSTVIDPLFDIHYPTWWRVLGWYVEGGAMIARMRDAATD